MPLGQNLQPIYVYPVGGVIVVRWSGWADSNCRSPAPKAGALPLGHTPMCRHRHDGFDTSVQIWAKVSIAVSSCCLYLWGVLGSRWRLFFTRFESYSPNSCWSLSSFSMSPIQPAQ